MAEATTIELERIEDGVRVLTLRDPARHNAISLAMRGELLAAAAAIADDPDARVLVVRGAGSSFCSGANLVELLQNRERDIALQRASLMHVYESFLAIRDLAIPTIAAVHGHAIGAGLNLAMCCDLRIAAPSARFGATFTKIGLHPGGGCTYFLTSALGPQRALSILLDGEALTGEEAVRLGLALELHDDPFEAALGKARRYAALPRDLAREIKATVRLTTEGLAASMAQETWAQAMTATRPEVWRTLAR